MFKPSGVACINGHTCQHTTEGGVTEVQWFLVHDASLFHVYVAAIVNRTLAIRIDWRAESRLEFEQMRPTEGDRSYPMGQSSWFCKPCIEEALSSQMEEYRLFRFNCRTLSYLILTQVGRLEPGAVYQRFQSLGTLCGLDPRECLSLEEIRHYIAHQKQTAECTII